MTNHLKLSTAQIALLKECCEYSLCAISGKLLRLGGYGNSPLRYNSRSVSILRDAGLIERGSIFRPTQDGINYIKQFNFRLTPTS